MSANQDPRSSPGSDDEVAPDPLDRELRAVWTKPADPPAELRGQLMKSIAAGSNSGAGRSTFRSNVRSKSWAVRALVGGAVAAAVVIGVRMVAPEKFASPKSPVQLSASDERFALRAVAADDDDGGEARALFALAAEQ